MNKFRPCLTDDMIQHITQLCIADGSSKSFLVLGVLAPFKAKIDLGVVKAAYSANESKPSADSTPFSVLNI